MDYPEIYTTLREKIRELKHSPTLTVLADTTLDDLGFTGDALIGLRTHLNQWFGLQITVAEIGECTTVRDVAKLIKSKKP